MQTAEAPAPVEPDLAAIIRRYNEVTERLKHSHDVLGGEVCRLRDELHRKNKELQRRERLAALGEMAAGVAHEIRNPLAGIVLYSSLLERDLADRPKERDLVRRIGSGVRNLEKIVRDTLDFAGGADPDRRNVKLGGLLERVLGQARPHAEAERVAVEIDAALRSAELFCDPGQIERALLNLLLNAVDAAGERGHVWIREGSASRAGGDAEDGLCHINIEDDGRGIESALLQRVFHPFFTTKHTGTGLGLAIVHRIAEANAGCVTAGNRESGGAVFVLSVPLANRAGKEAPTGGI